MKCIISGDIEKVPFGVTSEVCLGNLFVGAIADGNISETHHYFCNAGLLLLVAQKRHAFSFGL